MSSLSRRRLLQAAGVTALAGSAPAVVPGAATAAGPSGSAAAAAPVSATPLAALAPARPDIGVSTFGFDLGEVRLTASRWQQNQSRTLSYLRFVDVDRLLYNFRANHRLSTGGAAACGGWEDPNFEFRTHSQGHFLSAWANAWTVLGDTVCRDRALYMVAELEKCQANNAAAGFAAGYLSGFPESDFDVVETGNRRGVPYYCLHKTLAGLLDVWRLIGDTRARDVLLRFAAWVDQRTARLSYAQMQRCLGIEFGGMNAVLTDLYQQTGDERWLRTAQRFDHAAVFDPLAANRDELNGLHANTQVPKWIGAAREFKATGTTRYRDIARNSWDITVNAHTYVIGGNSEAEHFRGPNAIAAFLDRDTAEACNTYNMLKLTRELWQLDPNRAGYFDFYERALLNHLLGQQNPSDPHGHICYFTGLNPGHRRGDEGPVVGGGNWSTDYGTFWCCQGTALEVNTRLADSIYFYSGTTLTVNLFIPSVLTWTSRGITVTQATSYPNTDTTTLTVTGTAGGSWTMRVRIPAWTSDAVISVNGVRQNVAATPGSYAAITRTWASGDVVSVRLPMRTAVVPANDNPSVAAITYGPIVLAGDFGSTRLSALPPLDVASVARTGASTPTFTARSGASTVTLRPFHDAHGYTYSVYWNVGAAAGYRLVNAATGLVLGVRDISTADGASVVQWNDTGTADHSWSLITDGTDVRVRNNNSGKVLGVQDMSTAPDAAVVQWGDTGTPDHRWTIVDGGDGTHRVRNVNSGRVLGVRGGSTAPGAQIVQDTDDGSADNRWRFIPTGVCRIRNERSGLILGVRDMSTADGGQVIQWDDSGTPDHRWSVIVDAGGYFRLRNANSGKVLGVENAADANGARVLQWADNGTADHRWRLRHSAGGAFRIQCGNGSRVLGVTDMSTTRGAQVVLWADTGTADQLWRFI